jgi:hypothetical protein
MVRALLGGRKTQTRRALNPQPYQLESRSGYWNASGVVGGRIVITDRALLDLHRKPKPGDRLYVREHWRTTLAFDDLRPSQMKAADTRIRYEADGFVDNKLKSFDHFHEGRFRQGMHMPRWASRLTLIVTDVRVERLQNISEADASDEGVWHGNTFNRFADDLAASCQDGRWFPGATDWYRDLWDRINGPGAWDANPWVAAYTFTVIPKNIDEA